MIEIGDTVTFIGDPENRYIMSPIWDIGEKFEVLTCTAASNSVIVFRKKDREVYNAHRSIFEVCNNIDYSIGKIFTEVYKQVEES